MSERQKQETITVIGQAPSEVSHCPTCGGYEKTEVCEDNITLNCGECKRNFYILETEE